MSVRSYQVKEVARTAKVTVRTLHHYDQIGLLVPSGRSEAGYRLYSQEDLLRLQQILIGRALGLSLEEIRRMLDDPGYDRRQALERQRRQLEARARETRAMLRAVDEALHALEQSKEGGALEMDVNELFDGFEPSAYEEEARHRWGATTAYEESQRRSRRYSPDDWKKIKAEADAVMKEVAAARQAGRRPDDVEVMDLAERHRRHIDRWFYPCSKQMHAGLADLYLADPRFAANIDKYGAGLTAFWAAAIHADAAR